MEGLPGVPENVGRPRKRARGEPELAGLPDVPADAGASQCICVYGSGCWANSPNGASIQSDPITIRTNPSTIRAQPEHNPDKSEHNPNSEGRQHTTPHRHTIKSQLLLKSSKSLWGSKCGCVA
jgi:hypothetical protein